MIDDERWSWFKITPEFLDQSATWLKESRTLHGDSLRFFELAGTLIGFSRYDYTLASVAFFHAVLGLERALKLHFQNEDEKLRDLLKASVDQGIITDSTLGEVTVFTPRFAKQVKTMVGKTSSSRLEQFVSLLPKLRNEYFHGTYLLAPDYLPLTLTVRRMADALTTKVMLQRPR